MAAPFVVLLELCHQKEKPAEKPRANIERALQPLNRAAIRRQHPGLSWPHLMRPSRGKKARRFNVTLDGRVDARP
jgi:hypothetical protein